MRARFIFAFVFERYCPLNWKSFAEFASHQSVKFWIQKCLSLLFCINAQCIHLLSWMFCFGYRFIDLKKKKKRNDDGQSAVVVCDVFGVVWKDFCLIFCHTLLHLVRPFFRLQNLFNVIWWPVHYCSSLFANLSSQTNIRHEQRNR